MRATLAVIVQTSSEILGITVIVASLKELRALFNFLNKNELLSISSKQEECQALTRARVAVSAIFALVVVKWPHLTQKLRGIEGRRKKNFRFLWRSTIESISVIFSIRSILRSPEVIKCQFWRSVILFFRKCAIISEPIIGSRPRKKAPDSHFKALSLTCRQNWPNFNGLGHRSQ